MQELSSEAPVFAPDGSIHVIPGPQLQDAMAHGGKLAVQMKAPDGTLHYVPHDQVGAAQQAGGVVNTEQGKPDDPQPKEGFWHSLGAVFGLTPEQMAASRAHANEHPFQAVANALDLTTPLKNMVQSAASNAPGLAKKAYGEAAASNEAISHGDIQSFLAHQIGGMGYVGATVASPVLGNAPAKAGEQFGEGNVAGGLGTTTGLLAPTLLPEAPGAMKATGRGLEAAAPYVGKGVKEAARFGGVGEFIHTGNPVALAGPVIAPIAERAATGATSWLGKFLQKAGGAFDFTPQQAATIAKAESAANAVPSGEAQPMPSAAPESSGPSTLPRVASGEGVLNKALTALDNQSLLKIAKSRGINVTQEAQLKPGAANSKIINKIINDFSPDELDEVRNMGMEISRNLPVQNPNVTPEAAAEAWHYKVLNQFFPDVAVPKTMAARAQATIANRTFTAADVAKENFNRARAAAESKANAVPVDDLQGGHAGGSVTSVEELNRPGVNYVVSRSGQLTYQGKAFAPESTPSGATHVTVKPDGSFQVNAGPQLNAAQTSSLKFALKKQPWLKSKAGD